MPVTAKLSREFYEKFGDKIANELVEWFNQVDATYRADLRELNELNFARFDAKLEQRLAQLGAGLRGESSERFARVEARLERLEGAVTTLGGRVTALEGAVTTLGERMTALEGGLTAKVETARADLLRHMYGAILGAWATLLAAMITLFSLARG